MKNTLAIEIQGLTKFYRKLCAVDHVSFNVNEGDFFGFLGPNGAGKTTTISVITGLANIDSGSVNVFGHDVIRDYRKARALIGLVPQEVNLDPFLSAEQVLIYEAGYFGVPKRVARERARELMHQFNLQSHKSLDFRKLSGGLKRRLLIARALMHRPKILIVDEPTAGLDLELRYKLWDFFRDINRQGVTLFLTTHYIEEAEQLCNRIGVIHEGRMIEVDDKASLIKRMGQNLIEIQLDRHLDEMPKEIAEHGAELANGGNLIRLQDSAVGGQAPLLPKVLKTVHAHGIEVLGVDMKKTTLEEIFLRLTKREANEKY